MAKFDFKAMLAGKKKKKGLNTGPTPKVAKAIADGVAKDSSSKSPKVGLFGKK